MINFVKRMLFVYVVTPGLLGPSCCASSAPPFCPSFPPISCPSLSLACATLHPSLLPQMLSAPPSPPYPPPPIQSTSHPAPTHYCVPPATPPRPTLSCARPPQDTGPWAAQVRGATEDASKRRDGRTNGGDGGSSGTGSSDISRLTLMREVVVLMVVMLMVVMMVVTVLLMICCRMCVGDGC